MPFVKNDSRINRNGRPKGSANSELRKLLNENFDLLQLLKDIEELPKEQSIRYKVELLRYLVPALKSIEITDVQAKDNFTPVIIQIKSDGSQD